MEAERSTPPTHFIFFFKFSCGKLEPHSPSLGLLVCDLSWAPLVQSEDLRPSFGWYPHPSMYALTHSLGHLIGSNIVQCVSKSFMVAGPADGAAPDLGLAPLAVVECCWSFSLFGTVVLGLTGGDVAAGVGDLLTSYHSLAAPSGCLQKLVKIVGNCSELPRSSWLVRLNCTSFCAGLLGEHATVDSCSEGEWLAVHIRAISGWVSLTPFPGGSCWCSCSWGQLEEWCSCSPLSWEHGGISKGETHLEGILVGVQECTSLCWTHLWWALMALLLSAPSVWIPMHGVRVPCWWTLSWPFDTGSFRVTKRNDYHSGHSQRLGWFIYPVAMLMS